MDPEVVARVHILPTITYVNSVGDVVEKRSMKILYVRHTNLRSSGTQNKGSQLKPSSVRLIRTILWYNIPTVVQAVGTKAVGSLWNSNLRL
jgi:hypothetical protein